MGAENSKLRASSLRFLRTLSGRRYRDQSMKSDSTGVSMENLNQSKSDRNKNSSSRQQSSNKPKSESVRYKTKWPYPHVEKDFLPVYNMKTENQKDFTIIHIIASGAYGSVLKGFENRSRRDVAIKVIDKSRVLSEGHGAIQQCKDEVLIQSDLPASPYIVQLVSFWQTRNRLYLVLEYIPNGELFELWKIIRIFSESLARFYLSQVAMAIDFLHRNSVVYRDLKMENILLDSDGGIKLIDFGLSKRLALNDRTTTTCGTLQYTAPEVLKGEPYGHCVDWWSMGVLGYALLNGKFPVFGAKNHVEMRTMVANNQYRMPLHLSNEAADMLTSLLQKNPFSRIQSLDDLMKARYFRCCLNYAGTKLQLRHFITKQDVEKLPDAFPLKPIFEIAYSDTVKPALASQSSLLSGLSNGAANSDYAEPIWHMSSGRAVVAAAAATVVKPPPAVAAPAENGIREHSGPAPPVADAGATAVTTTTTKRRAAGGEQRRGPDSADGGGGGGGGGLPRKEGAATAAAVLLLPSPLVLAPAPQQPPPPRHGRAPNPPPRTTVLSVMDGPAGPIRMQLVPAVPVVKERRGLAAHHHAARNSGEVEFSAASELREPYPRVRNI